MLHCTVSISLQSPELMHLPRTMKLFELYTFTELKSVIMNKVHIPMQREGGIDVNSTKYIL